MTAQSMHLMPADQIGAWAQAWLQPRFVCTCWTAKGQEREVKPAYMEESMQRAHVWSPCTRRLPPVLLGPQ